MRVRSALAGLAMACAACSDERGGPEVPEAEAPTRLQRLLDHLAEDDIRSGWDLPRWRDSGPLALTEGLSPRFAAGFTDELPPDMHVWDRASSVTGPNARDAQIPPLTPPRVNEEGALRFDAASGLVAFLLPAQPDTPYAFEVSQRHPFTAEFPAVSANDTRRASALAEVQLYEFHEPPDPAAHSGDVWAALESALETRSGRHVLTRQPNDGARWQRRSIFFKSSVYTRSIAVVLIAGDPGWWIGAGPEAAAAFEGGFVEFDDVRLFELPLRRYLAVQDRSLRDDLAFLEHGREWSHELDPWRRKVKIEGDLRRALLAPPPTRVGLPFQIAAGRARVDLAFGVLEETRDGWAEDALSVTARLVTEDDRELDRVERSLAPGLRPEDRGWQEIGLACEGPGSFRLELAVTGAEDRGEVVAFAEPTVVQAEPDAAERPLNVLLISLDTLRADHLGCYGYERDDGVEVSPNLDAFARRCTVARNLRTVAPYTLPSHATMMTGLYPRVHGVIHSRRRLVPEIHPLLAEAFRDAGRETAAFTGGGFVGYEYGFHAGFDRYSIIDPMLTAEDPMRDRFPYPNDRAANDAVYGRNDLEAVESWIGRRRDAPWFVFLHSFLVHNYHPPEAVRRRLVPEDPDDWTRLREDLHRYDLEMARLDLDPPPGLLEVLRDLYDGTIIEADRRIGELLGFLEEQGLLDHTVVALTSDHGEEFGEHRGLLHGRTVYEEVLRVPLLLWVPGKEPSELLEASDLSDLAPTLLEVAGLPIREGLDGESLLGPRSGSWIWAEVDAENLSTRAALIEANDKRIVSDPSREEPGYEARRPDLVERYELTDDPGEQRPRPDTAEVEAAWERVRDELDERRAGWVPDLERLRSRVSPSMERLLEALGYVQTADD